MTDLEMKAIVRETIRDVLGPVIENEVSAVLRGVRGTGRQDAREERPLLSANDAGPYAEAQEQARQTVWRTVRPVSGYDVTGNAKHVELIDTPIGYLPLGDWTRRR